MKKINIKNTAYISFLVLLASPVLAVAYQSLGLSAEEAQYSTIQLLVMAAYNLPFIFLSIVGFVFRNKKFGPVLMLISNSLGIVIQFGWVLL